MVVPKTISLRKFNQQVRLVEEKTIEVNLIKEKLFRLRKKYKQLNVAYKALQEQFNDELNIRNIKLQELEKNINELQKTIQEKDKFNASSIDDLRSIVDQQKRELERIRIPAQGKSLIESSGQRLVEAPRGNYSHLVPGGKAGA
nr:hypothetical protein [uncultured Rhodoferax sp.]